MKLYPTILNSTGVKVVVNTTVGQLGAVHSNPTIKDADRTGCQKVLPRVLWTNTWPKQVAGRDNKVYGKEYHMVKYHFCEGNNQKNDKMMNDKDRQDYFVSLIKWVKNNYEEETRKEMILKQVPAKKIALRLTQYYNS